MNLKKLYGIAIWRETIFYSNLTDWQFDSVVIEESQSMLFESPWIQ